MSYSVTQIEDKWVVLKKEDKKEKIVASFDKQDEAWRYVDKKDTHELWKTSKRWHWGR